MFVLDNAGIGNVGISEVHDGVTLEIWHVERILLESHTAPFQLSEAIIKVFVNLTSIENMVSNTLPILAIVKKIRINTCLNTI